MATTQICSEINKNQQYPLYTTISAPNNCGTVIIQYSDGYTNQMISELPNITINIWTEVEGVMTLYMSRAITMEIPQDQMSVQTVLMDIPESCIFSLQPEFDSYAYESHNANACTDNSEDFWDVPTEIFPLKVMWDDTNVHAGGSGGGGGGGEEITVDTQVDPNSTNPVQNSAIYSFVNSSVSTNTAYFAGTYKTLADLEAVTPVTNNDYGFVVEVESAILTTEQPEDWTTNWTNYYTMSSGQYIPVTGDVAPTWQANTYYKADGVVYNRYKYNSETDSWAFEYALNNSSYTAAEWATIQSGLTAADKTQLQSNTAVITNLPNVYQKIEDIVVLTQAEYDALATKTARFYCIIEEAD